MRHFIAAVVVVAGFTGWAHAADAPKDLEKLQGDWKQVRSEQNGESNEGPGLTVRIKGDKLQLLVNGKPNEEAVITLKLDPSTDPKLIDVVLPNKSVIEGIYKLDGKKWTICVRTTADVKDRPAEFVGKGNNVVLLEFEREED